MAMFSDSLSPERNPLFMTLFFAVVTLAAPAVGQDQQKADDPKPESSNGAPALQQLPPGVQLIFTDPETGESNPVPGFSPSMLQSMQDRAQAQANRLYDIRQLNVEGELDKNFVRLTVSVWIEITVDDEWVTVPLAFDNYVIVGPAPVSRFQAARDANVTELEDFGQRFYFVQNNQPAKSFRFFGRGTHQLTLNLIGQVRLSNDRRRLRINSPAANQSYLKLQIPELIDEFRLSTERPFDQTENIESRKTILETWGLSGSAELSWLKRVDNTDKPTTIRQSSPTRMKLDLTTQPPSLVATQPLLLSGTPVKTVTMTFPAGFTDLSVSASTATQQNVLVDVIEQKNDQVTLEFETGLTGALNLSYNFEYPISGELVVIRPPDLLECTSESADIELLVPAGLQVDIQRTGEGSVKQKPTESPGSTRASQVAYRLLAEDSELTLKLEETTAFYSVAPTITFETEGNSLLMTASFAVNVLQGSVNSVNVKWPGYEEWQILNDYTQLVAGAQSTNIIPTQRENEGFLLEFPERQSRQFVVMIEAIRDLESFRSRDSSISLPDLPTTTQHTSIVSLVDSDDHSMELRSADGLTQFPALPTSRWPDSFRGTEDSRSVQLVDTPARPVLLTIRQQRSETRTQTALNLFLEENDLRIEQVLSYDVRYRDIDEIRLNTPPGIVPNVRLKSTAEPLKERSSDQDGIVYLLSKPARGQFDLLIDYYIPLASLSESGTSTVDIPLVIPGTIEPTLESIEVATDEIGRLEIESPDWQRIYSDLAASAWMTQSPVASIPVTIRPAAKTGMDRAELLVLKSAVVNNQLMSSTTYVPTEWQTVVKFELPENSELVMTSVNGESTSFVEATAGQNRQIELRSDSAINRATVVIRHSLIRSTLFSTAMPQFARPLNASEDSVCLWLMKLPSGGAVVPVNHNLTRIRLADDQTIPSATRLLASLPLPFSGAQRNQVIESINEVPDDSTMVNAFVGSMLQNQQNVYLLSRQTILMATAIIGLFTYFLLASLRTLPMLSVAAIAIAVVVIVLALIPPAATEVALKVLPGCIAAVLAAGLQRILGNASKQAVPEVAAGDSSTIFAIEEAAIVSPGRSEHPAAAVPSRAT